MRFWKFIFVAGVLSAFALPLFSEPVHAAPEAAVIVVNTADDWTPDGCDAAQCTLREAILAANATANVKETIKFDIPTSSNFCNVNTGVCTIYIIDELPAIEDPVVIDGYSQPGTQANTLQQGNNAILKIAIRAGAKDLIGLLVADGDSTIKGLVIQKFHTGIVIYSSHNVIQGNFIGTDVTGIASEGNYIGISIEGVGNLVGGTSPQARNLISGNAGVGIGIRAKQTLVQGNYLGTDRHGTSKLANSVGLILSFCENNTIGGSEAAARNIISGNDKVGMWIIETCHDNIVRGNYIGVAADTSPLGNAYSGIQLYGNHIARTGVHNNLITRNLIAHNGHAGVLLGQLQYPDDPSAGNAISRNSIFANGYPGIDIPPWTQNNPNDAGDLDVGANKGQNSPVLKKVSSSGGKIHVKGKFKSEKGKTYLIEFFSNPDCGGPTQGQTFRGSLKLTTNNKGKAGFNFSKSMSLAVGTGITATATELAGKALRSTSEFSVCKSLP